MLKLPLRGLFVAAVAAYAFAPSPAGAVTSVDSCRDLDKAGETYVLTANITATGSCFGVLADRITLDLGGHTVTLLGVSGGSRGVWDEGNSRTNTVVRNGTLTNFGIGIFFLASTRTTVRNITVFGNRSGIVIGSDSLVKDCTAQRNGLNGVEVGDRGQVENCLAGDAEPGAGVDGNGGVGIIGGQRILVTRSKANGNGSFGIHVGIRSTVSFSTASNNGDDGIAVFENSLITRNAANDNGGDGIEAVCPSTITHNTALDNLGENFNPEGDGCFAAHNTFSTDPQ